MKNKTRGSSASRPHAVEREFRVRRGSLRRIPRRHFATAEETMPRNCKVRVTMYLDGDIVEHFKARAARPDAAGYQTQINSALRASMENDSSEAGYERVVKDDRLLGAVPKRAAG